MTQKASYIATAIHLNLTNATQQYLELDEALTQAFRVARSIARQRGKTKNTLWVDEAIAEAYYIITEIILTSYNETLEKYPEQEARFKFYRMAIGYGLKAYFAYRSLNTLRYLKGKGIESAHITFKEGYVMVNDNSALMTLALEEIPRTQMESSILQFYMMGNSFQVISEKVGIAPKRVRKVMRRIKRRLENE